MVTCKYCKKDMKKTDTCIKVFVDTPRGHIDPIKYGDEKRFTETDTFPDKPCHDCGVKKGGYHHPGCDVEECPICRRQLISCGCLNNEVDDNGMR